MCRDRIIAAVLAALAALLLGYVPFAALYRPPPDPPPPAPDVRPAPIPDQRPPYRRPWLPWRRHDIFDQGTPCDDM